jgi:transcriptional regulator with XRE-family HTH domain
MADEVAPQDIGRRLAAARLQRGVSQGMVGQRAGIAPSYISRLETGKVQPTFRTVQRLATALRISLHELSNRPDPRRGGCPVTSSAACLLDLMRTEVEIEHGVEGEAFTPRQIRLLKRFAFWLRKAAPDRQRAIEVLIDELAKGVETDRRG